MKIYNSLISKLVEKSSSQNPISVKTPEGKIFTTSKSKPPFQIVIKSNDVYKAAMTKGSLGIGEQYMLGNLEIEGDFDLGLTTLLSLLETNKSYVKETYLTQAVNSAKFLLFPETKHKALRDIGSHYDLGNDFYSEFLDPTMTYSCAYFRKESDSLEKAQLQKYEHICRKLLLKPGESLIDVGCGWGGMLIYAVQKYGVSGLGITLSKNQHEYATDKIKNLGLTKKIKIDLKDYRDVTGQFDKFISIGMFEHVTQKYYDDYFRMIKRVLIPKGVGILHTIGVNGPESVAIDPWYSAYIFPGSQLPSARWITQYCGKYNLFPQDLENHRLHYALTLKHWATNYLKVYDKTVSEKGEKFARMWKWYLFLSRATFLVGISNLWQVTFTNGIRNDWPLTRGHLYRGLS